MIFVLFISVKLFVCRERYINYRNYNVYYIHIVYAMIILLLLYRLGEKIEVKLILQTCYDRHTSMSLVSEQTTIKVKSAR